MMFFIDFWVSCQSKLVDCYYKFPIEDACNISPWKSIYVISVVGLGQTPLPVNSNRRHMPFQ